MFEEAGWIEEEKILARDDAPRLLGYMTEKQLVVFALQVIGFSQEEIAQMLGITQSAVSQRFLSGINKVAEIVKQTL